jgi:membrane-bound metal-dependent hydrolase YbcI (DUF457 family)
MSGYLTHMAIGAAGGILLARAAPELAPIEPALLGPALAVVSAVAATWPDIDIEGSWISERSTAALAAVGAAVGLLMVPFANSSEGMAVAALGAVVGTVGGWALIALLRMVAGGHRGGTHSLVAAGLLAGSTLAMLALGAAPWHLLPLVMLWGWLLHIIGDVVTPGGWRPLAPFPGPSLRLPRAIARHGETVVSAVALAIVAAALGLPGLLAAVAGGGAALTLAGRREGRD